MVIKVVTLLISFVMTTMVAAYDTLSVVVYTSTCDMYPVELAGC